MASLRCSSTRSKRLKPVMNCSGTMGMAAGIHCLCSGLGFCSDPWTDSSPAYWYEICWCQVCDGICHCEASCRGASRHPNQSTQMRQPSTEKSSRHNARARRQSEIESQQAVADDRSSKKKTFLKQFFQISQKYCNSTATTVTGMRHSQWALLISQSRWTRR